MGEGVAINSGGVKCEHTIICFQRSGYSQFVPSSRGEQHGSWWKKQITDLMLVLILYLLMYQSWDDCVLFKFIFHFWSKIDTWRGVEIRMYWCIFSKKKVVGRGKLKSNLKTPMPLQCLKKSFKRNRRIGELFSVIPKKRNKNAEL